MGGGGTGIFKHIVSRCWVAVPGAFAGLTLTAHWREWPNAAFWADRDPWIWVAVAIVALVAIAEPIRNGVQAALDDRQKRRAGAIRDLLHVCLIQADEATNDSLVYFDIGVHVWEVRWQVRLRWPFAYRRLVKLDDIRLSDTLGRSRVVWTKGKGVIGQCWTLHKLVSRDLDEFVGFNSAEDWELQDADFRLNLSWEEFQRTKSYGGVMAAPMFAQKDDRFRGCVSIDGPKGTYHTIKDVEEVLSSTANAIAGKLYDERPG